MNDLIVRLQAQTEGFKRRMNDARKRMKKFADQARSDVEKIKSGFAVVSSAVGGLVRTMAAGTAVAAGFFAAMTIKAGTIKQIQQLADVTGVAVENIQQWQFAGKAVGIETEKMGDIFRDASEKLGELIAVGGGEAKELFEKLGLDAAEFVGIPIDQAFLKIAGQMDNLTKNERNALFEMLASDARELIPLLENGAERFKELSAQAQATGNVLSADAVKGAVKFREQWDLMVKKGQGFITQLTAKMAPAMTVILERINQWVDKFGGMEKVAENAAKFIIKSIKGVISGFSSFLKSLGNIEAGWKRIQMAVIAVGDAVAQTVNLLTPSVWAQKFGVNFSDTTAQKFQKDMEGVGVMLAEEIRQLETMDPMQLPIINALDGLLTDLNNTVGSSSGTAAAASQANNKSRQDNTNALNALRSRMETYTERLNSMIVGGKDTGSLDLAPRQQQFKQAKAFEDAARRFQEMINRGTLDPRSAAMNIQGLQAMLARYQGAGGFDTQSMQNAIDNLGAAARDMFLKPNNKPLTAAEYEQVFRDAQEKAKKAEEQDMQWRKDNHESLLTLKEWASKQTDQKTIGTVTLNLNNNGSRSSGNISGPSNLLGDLVNVLKQVQTA